PATPTLHYPASGPQVRILCGYVQCHATNFAPFRAALPEFIHLQTAGHNDWLGGTIAQIVTEVDQPQPGGGPILERLTEIAFLEILRRQFQTPAPKGWLAAILDPTLSRALLALHDDPGRDWTLPSLAATAGASRSALTARFADLLNTSPMRYLRDWRLYLAAEALASSTDPIISVATKAGYGTEAAFTRAFSRVFHCPPAEWRRRKADH
ncbi:MAG TPA: AraC family transcriptional regulator, partial [Tabrizicola sp.]|nr:AraC family transcriptional regulator [Tabrizicola sp.]